MRALVYFLAGLSLAGLLNACDAGTANQGAAAPVAHVPAVIGAASATEARNQVQAFFAMHIKEGTRGVPDGEVLQRYRPYFSQHLNGLIEHALRVRDHAIATEPEEKPPFVDGDVFTSLFEGATGVDVEPSGPDPARLALNFVHEQPGEPATRWSDYALLVQEDGAWKIDDIEYGGGWEFSSHGRLSKSLRNQD